MGRALRRSSIRRRWRDLMFVHDGQFGFKPVSLCARRWLCSGPAAAAETLVIMAELAWFFRACRLGGNSSARRFGLCDFCGSAAVSYGAPIRLASPSCRIPALFAEAFGAAGLAALAADSMRFRFAANGGALVHRSWPLPDLESFLPSSAWKKALVFVLRPRRGSDDLGGAPACQLTGFSRRSILL